MEYFLSNDFLSMGISLDGGSIIFLRKHDIDILRPLKSKGSIYSQSSACFPLIPFGNRMQNNALTIDNNILKFTPNTLEPYYLHGDGWLNIWQLDSISKSKLSIGYNHSGVFLYEARETFELINNELIVVLEIENKSDNKMVAGLGLHPYFAFYDDMYVNAACTHYWSEDKEYLPLKKYECNGYSGKVKREWINTCYEGWDGTATIETNKYKVLLNTYKPMHYFQTFFMEDEDFFCFEPMGHRTNGFANWQENGYNLLDSGERVKQIISFKVF